VHSTRRRNAIETSKARPRRVSGRVTGDPQHRRLRAKTDQAKSDLKKRGAKNVKDAFKH